MFKFILVFLIILYQSFSESIERVEFEGIITYKVEVKSNQKHLTNEALYNLFGDTLKYYYQNGNYKMIYNGKNAPTIFYLIEKNKEYTLLPNYDTLISSDCGKEETKLLYLKDTKYKFRIGDKSYSGIELANSETTYKYFFDKNYYINPNNYIFHKLGFLDKIHNKSNGVTVRYERYGESFDLVQTLIKVENKKLNKNIFGIPNLPIKEDFN